MPHTHLLTVEDHFLIEGRGLVVVPTIDLPAEPLRFTAFTDEVRIMRPDGTDVPLVVKFGIEHLSLRGGGSKWTITPMFPNGTKESIPIGSRIVVREETIKKLNGIETGPPNS